MENQEGYFKLKPWQTLFVKTEAQFPAMISAWGTGKSLCLILRVMRLCEKYPNNLALIVRREFTDLRDSTIKDFELYTGLKVGSNKEVKLPNGSVIMFRHGEELNTLQNINLGVCGIEQGEEFDDDSQWFMLFGRMRRKNCGNPSLFLIANANGDDWINRLWPSNASNRMDGYELYEATTHDNADILPESFLKSLDTLKLQKPSVYQQYVLNNRDVTSGKIFPMWNESIHVIPDQAFPDWWERFGVIDTAVASGVFCAIKFTVSPEGDLYAYGEYYDKGLLISEHCEGIRQMLGQDEVSYWHFDPAAFSKTRENKQIGRLYSVADELKDYGIVGVPAENDVNAGINRLGEYLKTRFDRPHYITKQAGAPRIYITESCVNTRREIPRYREVPNKISDRGDRKWLPYKKDDHSVDVLRYAVMSRPVEPVNGIAPPEPESLDYYERMKEYHRQQAERQRPIF